MFDAIRNNSRVLFLVLLLLIIPSFVFFGLDGYTRFREGRQVVAQVGRLEITQSELDEAHRRSIERVRQQMPGVDIAMFDTPAMKQSTLESLVRERVLALAADQQHLVTGDERVRRIFRTDPQFEFLRRSDGTVNQDILSAQGMSSEQFAETLRRDLSLRQVIGPVAVSAVAGTTARDQALDAFLQAREVQWKLFAAKDFSARVQPTDEELQAYYEDPAHASQFQSPEFATVEYLVLDLEAVKRGLTVSDEDLRKYYEENISRYSTPEERRASHILIKTEGVSREQARAQAQELLDQLKARPEAFADMARQHSQDPGSAAQGGDLGFFGRGAMVKPFEDAVYALKPGQLSELVETDFGFHIIRLTEVRGGQRKPFEAVRAEIEDAVRSQLAQTRFAEVAEQFSNLVYEQPDSLQPAATALGLQVRKAERVQRQPASGTEGPLSNARLLEALFSADSIASKRNTQAIEVGPGQLVSARIVEHSPARTLPLEEVRDRVRERVVARKAAELAHQEGQAKLAAWKASPESASLEAPKTVSRLNAAGLPSRVLRAALAAAADALPAWVGVDLGDEGYAVVRVNKVLGRDPSPAGEPLKAQYIDAWGAAEAQAYYASLKERFKVKVQTVSR
ncbi:SurA N-terminal domain-containing protein [Caldimonas taiwanensis]|uniref:SurA N-terminal domain-containing protein n=1 Tax=Caldimonas taiwanensis TaxID=307483 RepID=UPI00078349B0|nr:SurA N-terminal domain-containing protein [Caldimonas taiwanensis]